MARRTSFSFRPAGDGIKPGVERPVNSDVRLPSLYPPMNDPIKVALIVALGALVGHWFVQFLMFRSKLRGELRDKRISVYTDLLRTLQTALEKGEHGAQFIRDASLTTGLIAWATPDVIIATTTVWQTLEAEKPREELLAAVADLLASIRKDFGHDDQEAKVFYDLIAELYVPKTAAENIAGPERL